MKVLRTLSTRSLIVLVALVAALAAGGAAIAVAAGGGSGPTPPAKSLPQALHDALSASEPDGITARIKFTNKLFPSGALVGNAYAQTGTYTTYIGGKAILVDHYNVTPSQNGALKTEAALGAPGSSARRARTSKISAIRARSSSTGRWCWRHNAAAARWRT